MKKLKNYLLLGLLAVVTGFSFTACNDDDDEKNDFNPSALTGVWEQIAYQMTEVVNGTVVDKSDTANANIRLEFEADNTISLLVNESADPAYPNTSGTWAVEETGSYSVRGNMILVLWEGDSEEEYIGSVIELSSERLTVQLKISEIEDGNTYDYFEKATYRKVN